VVADPVEDDAQLTPMRFVDQPIERLQRAESRLDVAIVADVIAELFQRRRITRRQPDRIDAEPFEIVEACRDTIEIAQTVAVGIEKRWHEQLVDRSALPPRPFGQDALLAAATASSQQAPCQYELKVADAMSRDIRVAKVDDRLEDVELLMRELKIRRVPVTDESGRLVGIVSLADFARVARGRAKPLLIYSHSLYIAFRPVQFRRRVPRTGSRAPPARSSAVGRSEERILHSVPQ